MTEDSRKDELNNSKACNINKYANFYLELIAKDIQDITKGDIKQLPFNDE